MTTRRTSSFAGGYADSRTAALDIAYRRIGSNVESELFNKLAQLQGCFEAFWVSVEPVFDSCLIRSAADELRRRASEIVQATLCFPDHLAWLTAQSFSREDIRQIRYIVESFYNLEPVFAVLCAIARRWADGAFGETMAPRRTCERSLTDAAFAGAIQFADNQVTLRNPDAWSDFFPGELPPFYKALAIWPDYLEKLRADLTEVVNVYRYDRAAQTLFSELDTISGAISPSHGSCNHAVNGMEETTRWCTMRSCEVVIVSSALRRMYTKAEIGARMRRICLKRV